MRYTIQHIEGIGSAYGAQLRMAGIVTTARLLQVAADPAGRQRLARTTGIDAGRLLHWANMADLMRIKGVGKQFAELLEAAGVGSVEELRSHDAADLTARMAAINSRKKLTRAVPSETLVARWIVEANELAPILGY